MKIRCYLPRKLAKPGQIYWENNRVYECGGFVKEKNSFMDADLTSARTCGIFKEQDILIDTEIDYEDCQKI
jgi:hypothetical protein